MDGTQVTTVEDVTARRRGGVEQLERLAVRAIALGHQVTWHNAGSPAAILRVDLSGTSAGGFDSAAIAYYPWASPRDVHTMTLSAQAAELLDLSERLVLLHAQLTAGES